MTLARTNVGNYSSTTSHGTGAFTTPSFTPPANSLLQVIVAAMENGGTTDPSGDLSVADTGGGLTYTPRINQGNTSSWSIGQRFWTAPVGSSPTSMTLSLDCAARNIYQYHVHVVAHTDYDTGSPLGATASNNNFGTNGGPSLTLSGAPASTSETIAALAVDSPPDNVGIDSAGGAWALLASLFQNDSVSSNAQARGAGSTSTTVTPWSDIANGASPAPKSMALAYEVKQAAAGGSTGTGGLASGGRLMRGILNGSLVG